MGNGKAKKLKCTTHGHELSGECREEGDKGKKKIGTTVIAKSIKFTLPLFSTIVVCEVHSSVTCLLIRLSGSRGSWPRNESKIGPFPNGFGWKLVIKSGTTPRGDIGEEPNWVHKESHMTLEKKQTGSVRKGTSEMSHIFMLYSCCLPLEVTEKRPPLSGQFGSLLGIGLFFSWYFSFSSTLVH